MSTASTSTLDIRFYRYTRYILVASSYPYRVPVIKLYNLHHSYITHESVIRNSCIYLPLHSVTTSLLSTQLLYVNASECTPSPAMRHAWPLAHLGHIVTPGWKLERQMCIEAQPRQYMHTHLSSMPPHDLHAAAPRFSMALRCLQHTCTCRSGLTSELGCDWVRPPRRRVLSSALSGSGDKVSDGRLEGSKGAEIRV